MNIKIRLIYFFVLLSGFLFLSGSGKKKQDSVLIGAVGDILLAYKYTEASEQYGYSWAFLDTEPVLKSCDLVTGNLESPLSGFGTPVRNKSFYFQAPPSALEALKFAGIRVLNVANNHTLDFGERAFLETLSFLRSSGFYPVGGGENRRKAFEPVVVQKNGLRVCFAGFNQTRPVFYRAGDDSPGTAWCEKNQLPSLIKEYRKKADIIVLIFHWGEEYKHSPSEEQVSMARAAIDAGADMVLGHHPHVLQPLEIYKGKLIAYSLGNFVFGSYGYPPKKIADRSMILMTRFRRDGLSSVEIVPLNVFNFEVNFQTRILEGERALETLNFIDSISAPRDAPVRVEGNRGFIDLGL